jgi:hypothetical protein
VPNTTPVYLGGDFNLTYGWVLITPRLKAGVARTP